MKTVKLFTIIGERIFKNVKFCNDGKGKEISMYSIKKYVNMVSSDGSKLLPYIILKRKTITKKEKFPNDVMRANEKG